MKYLILALALFASSVFASVNISDYIAPCDPYPQDTCFQAAIDAANGEPVHVPSGNYWLTGPTASAAWIVDSNVSLYNPPIYPTGNDNLSYLTGIVSQIDHDTETGLIVGSMDFQPYVDVRPSAIPHAMINGVNPYGKGAISAYTRTGAKNAASEGTIGVTTYVLNDNETSPGVAYGEYTEVIKWPNAGATFGDESNLTCYGALDRILPSGVYGNTSQICSNYWIGGPVGTGPLNGQYSKSPTSAGITFAGGTAKGLDGKNLGFDAGIVFTRKAFESSYASEIIRTFTGSQIIWHGSGWNPKGAIGTWETSRGGEVWIKVWDSAGAKSTFKFTPDGLILPSGKILN